MSVKVLKALSKQEGLLASKTDKNIEQVRVAEHKNCRTTIQELADDLNLSVGLVQSINTENVEIRRVSAKCVPKVLKAVNKAPTHKSLSVQQFLA